MKEFNLKLAKSGAKVQTRDGRPARIVCYDRKNGDYPILALVMEKDFETPYSFTLKGHISDNNIKSKSDLVMAPTKKEGWVNVYYDSIVGKYHCGNIYNTIEEAMIDKVNENYIKTTKIKWEE